MRRFRLLSDSLDDLPLIKGCVYNECYHPENWEHNVLWNAENNPSAWEEVLEPEIEPKPLHKDTDLGLFSAMILSEIGNNPNYKLVPKIKLVSESIELAQELIKQLDSLHDTAPNHNE